jgi:hypothetical protein
MQILRSEFTIPAGRVRTYDLAMALEAGQVFAGYTILRLLGAGGMGQVYLAAHPRLPREDALKVLPSDLTANPEFRGRFLREADLGARLSHPHIVGIHDRGEENGQFWISMDYVAGTDVGRLLEQYPGGMPLEEVVAIVTAVGSALDYAHHRGLLHRDVKPANILLADPDGHERRVYLADFGVARPIDDSAGLTGTNMTVGTVYYSPPEQLRGVPIDGRADQYALACTAFHMLTGAPPYGDSNPAVVINKHVNAPPPPIGARRAELAGLDPTFATALAKEPSHRFGSCQEFADQLARQLGPGVPRSGTIPFPPTQPPFEVTVPASAVLATQPIVKKRRTGLLIGALLGALVLIAGGVFAAVKLTGHHAASTTAHSTATAPAGAPSAAPNTGPFTGAYTVRFGPVTKMDGTAVPGATPATDQYAVRSVCGSNGCVATAAMLSGGLKLASSVEFDQVGDRWMSVTIDSLPCQDAASPIWQVFTLTPAPDGTLTGEYTAAAANDCAEKRTVTFTRTGDTDLDSLPDPAKLTARVVSPGEALHGSYHNKLVFKSGLQPQNADEVVTTNCLRTGDKCMSYFYSHTKDTPLVFDGGKWVLDERYPVTVQGCTNLRLTTHGEYPMPQPPQNPVMLLQGHGHHEQTGNCSVNVDFDETLTRTGD